MISYNSGDGIPRLSAVAATAEATGEPVAAVTFEVPYLMSEIANGSRDKAIQECRDVTAFITASGAWPGQAAAVVPGPHPNHPPDVTVRLQDGSVGVEVTQIFLPAGGPAASAALRASFERLTDEVVRHSAKVGSRLRALRGHLVVVFFDRGAALPPRPKQPMDVIQFLATVTPRRFLGRGDQFPDKMPEGTVHYNADQSIGASCLATPGVTFSSLVWRTLGFELGLGYQRTVTQAQVRTELSRLVGQHDQPGVDVLLITIGSPTRDGWVFPSGGIVMDLLAGDQDPLAGRTPTHIRCIVIHDYVSAPEQPRIRILYGTLP